MGAALYHPREGARLKAVAEYGLDSDVMQAELEPLHRLASALFEVPTSMVSVVARERTLFASRIGIEVCDVERGISFCTHTLDRQEPLVVLDASLDPRFSANPLVSGPAHVRFYAGAPLIGPSGHVIGAFCLLDTRPGTATGVVRFGATIMPRKTPAHPYDYLESDWLWDILDKHDVGHRADCPLAALTVMLTDAASDLTALSRQVFREDALTPEAQQRAEACVALIVDALKLAPLCPTVPSPAVVTDMGGGKLRRTPTRGGRRSGDRRRTLKREIG